MDRKMAEVRTWLWRSVRAQVNTSEGSKPANRDVTYANMWRGGATCLLRKSTLLRSVHAWSMRMRQFHVSSLVKNNVIVNLKSNLGRKYLYMCKIIWLLISDFTDLTGYRESGSSVGNIVQDFIRDTCDNFLFRSLKKSIKNLSRRSTNLNFVIKHLNMGQLQKGVLVDSANV